MAQGKTVTSWKRWIRFSARPRGRLVLDHGARHAIESDGRSLLSIGVIDVEGTFAKGDVVALCDPSGEEFARGLTNYGHQELLCIKGLRTEQIAEALGCRPYDEVVHRNNLAVIV
jgi:glutamate 5-kinase